MIRASEVVVWIVALAALLGMLAMLTGCGGGSTSSNTCQTFTDANGNPVTQCEQG